VYTQRHECRIQKRNNTCDKVYVINYKTRKTVGLSNISKKPEPYSQIWYDRWDELYGEKPPKSIAIYNMHRWYVSRGILYFVSSPQNVYRDWYVVRWLMNSVEIFTGYSCLFHYLRNLIWSEVRHVVKYVLNYTVSLNTSNMHNFIFFNIQLRWHLLG